MDGVANAGSNDILLMKFDSSGERKLTLNRGSSASEEAHGVALDDNGNVFITGYTMGELDGQPNAGRYDIHLMKFSESGTWQFTRQRGNADQDYAYAVAVDSTGSVWITGRTSDDLDGLVFSGTQALYSDAFLMKFSNSGDWQFTRMRGTSSSTQWPGYLTIDSKDNVFMGGKNSFGALDGSANAGANDVFFMKFDSSGVWQFTRQYGTSKIDYCTGLAVDDSDNVYIAGVTFGSFDGYTLQGPGNSDAFLLKFTNSGDHVSTAQYELSPKEYPEAMAVDSGGNVAIAGTWCESTCSGTDKSDIMVMYNPDYL
jgi:hypothetical protein